MTRGEELRAGCRYRKRGGLEFRDKDGEKDNLRDDDGGGKKDGKEIKFIGF